MVAHEEYIKKAVESGRVWQDLPERVKNILPFGEWRNKVKELCIQRGDQWDASIVRSVCSEQEYYEELVRVYKAWGRLYPYHLADYVARVLRINPFRYYSDVLFLILKDERSYDRIPNFTAADALRVTGIGRNEYIAILNACKAKRLLWRVNKAIARDLLPASPLDTRTEEWWLVHVVNVGETEYRELPADEAQVLHAACDPKSGAPVRARDMDGQLLAALLRKGLVYLEVPVVPTDRFSIPPLEGFVSNKTSEQGDSSVDPLETLLYSVFVANSERMTVADLATILDVSVAQLQVAMSLACRLGFASKVSDDGAGKLQPPVLAPSSKALQSILEDTDGPATLEASARVAPSFAVPADDAVADGQALAVVVDAEATSYLMMGALSPGLKRHSVTLFEGGRVTGDDVMRELISELWASYKAGQGFEGDMQKLTHYTAALATLLEAVRDAGGGRPLELLRKESLAGLDPAAARKVLSHAYCAIIPIHPLPPPALPLSPSVPGPTYYGPTSESASPWLQLALYSCARCGPLSVVFVAGQRVWRLPAQLEGCTHALLWSWDVDPKAGADAQPQLIEGTFLLYTLNEQLSRTAVMVQPLVFSQAAITAVAETGTGIEVVDIALPLAQGGEADGTLSPNSSHKADATDRQAEHHSSSTGASSSYHVEGVERSSGERKTLLLPASVRRAVEELGLSRALGFLRMLRAPGTPSGTSPDAWLPLTLHLGVPLYCLHLCKDVCARASAASFLTAEARAAHRSGLQQLQAQLWQLISQHALGTSAPGGGAHQSNPAALLDGVLPVELPIASLLFDGTNLQVLDMSDCCQGTACLVAGN